jgi:hypothetical protein
MTTYKLFADKLGGTNPNEFIGNKGDLFYDPDTGKLRLSDGVAGGKNIDILSDRPKLLVFGNSIASTHAYNAIYTGQTVTAFNAGVNTITLSAGGVAAGGYVVGDTIAIGLANISHLIAKITTIVGEVLTLDKFTPLPSRTTGSTCVKLTASTQFNLTQIRDNSGFFSIANSLLGSPCKTVGAFGWGGSCFINNISHLGNFLDYYKPNYVAFIVLENDIGAGQSSDSLIRAINQAALMCTSKGITPIFNYCLPSNSIDDVGKSTIFDTVNAYLENIKNVIPGAKSVDFGVGLYLDTSVSASRRPLSGWSDGVHPNGNRYLSMAKYALPELSKIIGIRDTNTSFNLISSNPLLTGIGGTQSGLQANSISPASTSITAPAGVTCTTSRDANGFLKVDFTISGASDILNTQITVSQTLTNLHTQVSGEKSPCSANTLIRGIVVLDNVSMHNVSMLQLSVTSGSMVADVRNTANYGNGLTQVNDLIDDVFVIETPPLLLSDSTATNVSIKLSIRPLTLSSPSGVTGSFVIKEFGLQISDDVLPLYK